MTDNKGCKRGKLHVVYDVSYPFVEGGGQKRIYEIAKRLAQRGWDVQWFTFKVWEGVANFERDGIRYIGLNGYAPLYAADGRRSSREAVAFGRAVWSSRHLIRDADILWCGQWPYLHLLPLMFGGQARRFVDWWEIWGGHWFHYFGPIKGLVGYCVEKLFIAFCSRRCGIITISPRGTRDVVGKSAKTGAVYMIPNGIDIKNIDLVSTIGDPVDIIYVGRLKDHKNIDHIIRALHILKSQYGIILTAEIIGGGPEEIALRELSDDLGVAHQVRFSGSVDEEQKYARIKSARIFVHPSTKEGGGSLAVLEAHACGVPVIIYNAPQGIDPEMISEGVTGWVVNSTTPAALAKRLADILHEADVKRRVTYLNCRNAALLFDWEIIAKSYDKLFIEQKPISAE